MRPTKVVFLDIDGVLNYANCRLGPNRTFGIDPARVRLVEHLCRSTGSHIVVSSTWRLGRSISDLRDLLIEHGLTDGRLVIGKTPDLTTRDMRGNEIWTGVERGHEIAEWLSDHPTVTQFVILDDDSDMAHLRPHLVQTSFETGLTAEHVELAEKVLREMERAP